MEEESMGKNLSTLSTCHTSIIGYKMFSHWDKWAYWQLITGIINIKSHYVY